MKFKVLLIDDEPGALEGMQLWIDWEELGFEVCGTCSNGYEGMQLMGELEPDLVVTDITMPLMSGLEMIEQWQKVGAKAIRFIILSGYSEFEYARRALRNNVARYLLKPIEEDEAAKELRALYLELQREAEKRSISAIANYEEIVIMLKEAIMRPPVSESSRLMLEKLSASREEWSLCLLQTDPGQYAALREEASAWLKDKEAMYILHFGQSQLGIVFGYSPDMGQGDSTWQAITRLSQLCVRFRVFMTVGVGEQSLCRLESCYITAQEAIRYKFYDPTMPGSFLISPYAAGRFMTSMTKSN